MFKNWKYRWACVLLLGEGATRRVYLHRYDPNRVVKVALDSDDSWFDNAHWCNIIEWQIWKAVKNTPYAQHFAECYEISKDGKYLVQERINDVGKAKLTKKTKLPEFIADVHESNVGLKNGKPVIFDYGFFRVPGKRGVFST